MLKLYKRLPSLGLSPDGESGLKWQGGDGGGRDDKSLPGWGEWVEIMIWGMMTIFTTGLSPDGESGLKL